MKGVRVFGIGLWKYIVSGLQDFRRDSWSPALSAIVFLNALQSRRLLVHRISCPDALFCKENLGQRPPETEAASGGVVLRDRA